MALVVPRQAELILLDRLLKETSITDGYILKLFSNDFTPDEDTGANSLTEASFTGYTAFTLARSGWNAAQVSGSEPTKSESSFGASPQSWTTGASGQTIFGYWMETQTGANILWAERFATARVLDTGDVLNLTPKFTLASEN